MKAAQTKSRNIMQHTRVDLRLDSHLFVKVPRPGDSEVTFSIFSQAATCYYQSNHSLVEAITLSALPKNTTSKLAGLSSHYSVFMLNVKQGSCEYQLLKSFDRTRPEDFKSVKESYR